MSLLLPVLFAVFTQSQSVEVPAFPEKWIRLTELVSEKRDGKSIARIPAPEGKPFTATGFTLVKPLLDRILHLTVYLRGEGGPNDASINGFAYSGEGDQRKLVKNSSKTFALKSGEWTKEEADLVAPAGSSQIAIWIVNSTKAPIDVSEPSLSLGPTSLAALNGPGVLRASSQTVVAGKGGEVKFPIPSPYRDQAPLTFQLKSNPPAALKSYKIEKRADNNWICVAQVNPPQDKSVLLHWESLVLIRKQDRPEPPKAGFGATWPAEARQWLESTPVVQSDDPGVIAKADQLKQGCTDIAAFVNKVIEFTSQNKGTGQAFVSLDAKAALGCGGSCTSRANLAAALLRAGGIPARTVPHLPTWAYGSLLYEHWLTEYWHPGVGWVWVEPTMGIYQPEPSTLAALCVSSIDDEMATGKPDQKPWIMPGAAWMSGIQAVGDLVPAGTSDESDGSWCKPERRLEVTPELFKAATARWPKISDPAYVDSIERAYLDGSADVLAKLIKG